MQVYLLVSWPAHQCLPGTGMLVGGFPPLLVCGASSVSGGFGGPSLPCSRAPPLSKHLGEKMFSLGWFLLTQLPWNLPAVPGICTGPPPNLDDTSSQVNELATSLNVAKCNLAKVNLEPMRLAVSRICGVAARACFTMCLGL